MNKLYKLTLFAFLTIAALLMLTIGLSGLLDKPPDKTDFPFLYQSEKLTAGDYILANGWPTGEGTDDNEADWVDVWIGDTEMDFSRADFGPYSIIQAMTDDPGKTPGRWRGFYSVR